MKLPALRHRQVVRMFRKLDVDLDQPNEVRGWLVVDGRKILRFTFPPRHGGSDDLSTGAARRLERDSGLDRAGFLRLYECPMGRDEYLSRLRDSGLLES